MDDPRITDLAPDEVTVITGGEPLLSRHLGQAITAAGRTSAGFRIATGGHVAIHALRTRLADNPAFLGFNIGTDILIRQRDPRLERIWRLNWDLVSHDAGTWLTITVGGTVGREDTHRLISDLRPLTVMLNELDLGYAGFEELVEEVGKRFPEVLMVEGYRARA